MAKIITITSSKTDVEKSCICLNLSLYLVSRGLKICLLDTDSGPDNVSNLTGIYPDKNIGSIISGQAELTEIMIKNYHGLDIIPSSPEAGKIIDLAQNEINRMIRNFRILDPYDYFIVNTSAGFFPWVFSSCLAADEVILVVPNGQTALNRAYTMLKMFSKYQYQNPVKLILNRVKSMNSAKQIYITLKKASEKHLQIHLEILGILAKDPNIKNALFDQTPFIRQFPETPASKCIRNIASKLSRGDVQKKELRADLFWEKYFNFIGQYLKTSGQNSLTNLPVLKKTMSRIECKVKALSEEMSQIRTWFEGQVK